MRRRNFVLGTAAALGGGLTVGLFVRDHHFARRAARITAQAGGQLLAGWVRIARDGGVTVYLPHADMGQGASTGLAMIVADELDADWSRLTAVQAPADAAFANGFVAQGLLLDGLPVHELAQPAVCATFCEIARLGHLQATGASASIRMTGYAGLRVAAAAARTLLTDAAAARWGVAAAELRTQGGVVRHPRSGRQAGYGELADAAATLSPPRWPDLKPRSQRRLVGRSVPRIDVPAKVQGQAEYGIDVQLPGMLVATVRAAPVHGAHLESVDSAPALRVAGVPQVVRLERAVAVIADGYWPAQQGLDALQPQFSRTPADKVDSALQSAQLLAALEGPLHTVHERGAPSGGPATRTLVAHYEVPYLHHAAMEPINVTARFAHGKLDVWGSEQDALGARMNMVAISGLATGDVSFHPMSLGGGFGGRSAARKDHLEQVWQLARATSPQPVKLIWSREEDFAQGACRPAEASRMEARLGEDGAPMGWVQRFTSAPGLTNDGWPVHYAIPHLLLQSAAPALHLRSGAWRSMAHSQHGFFTEGFIDELAGAAGRDPYEFRRDLLPAASRHRRVLEEAARRANWKQPLAPGRGRGIAMVESFGSIVAQVIEASIDAQGTPRVHRVLAVVDCGLLVNPDAGRQQVEGAIVMGLSAALGEAITVQDGAVVQRSFPDYPVLRLAQVPAIEVHFLESDTDPGGLGAVGLPPVAPALVNALASAGAGRIRRLPIGRLRPIAGEA